MCIRDRTWRPRSSRQGNGARVRFRRVFAVALAVAAAASLALGVGALAGPSSIVANGSFATGDLTDWTVVGSGSSTPPVVSFNTTGSGASNSASFNVGQGNNGLSQSVTLTPGTYDFSADVAVDGTPNGGNLDCGTFSLVLDLSLIHI